MADVAGGVMPWPRNVAAHVQDDHHYTRGADYDLWHYLAHLAGDADHDHVRADR